MPRYCHVISPHLDDAALSCTMFLAANPGCRLTTVFAGGPASVRPLTPWDRGARYFAEGADVMGVRRGEDSNAAALVNATAVHFTYWDRQYRNPGYGYSGPGEQALAPLIAEDLLKEDAGNPAAPGLFRSASATPTIASPPTPACCVLVSSGLASPASTATSHPASSSTKSFPMRSRTTATWRSARNPWPSAASSWSPTTPWNSPPTGR